MSLQSDRQVELLKQKYNVAFAALVAIVVDNAYPFGVASAAMHKCINLGDDEQPQKRVQRFKVGDKVRISAIDDNSISREVLEVHLDPHPTQFAHCSGNSARYVISSELFKDGATVWDYQLAPATLTVAQYDFEHTAQAIAAVFDDGNALQKFLPHSEAPSA